MYGPVARPVVSWTPCSESAFPGSGGPGCEALRAPGVYKAQLAGIVTGRSQTKLVTRPAVHVYVHTFKF